METGVLTRTKRPAKTEENDKLSKVNVVQALRQLGGLSLFEFLQVFWDEVSQDKLHVNWHMEYLCKELEKVAERVAEGKPKYYDLIINIPPGTTKTIICLIMFPAWAWSRWYWMQFIAASYSSQISLKSAVKCRDLVLSDKYKMLYPELGVKDDENTKSDFRIIKREQVHLGYIPRIKHGGGRFATSVGGTVTGFHGHIILVDDPVNPQEAASAADLATANRFMEDTLPTRKTDKKVTPTILVMQRLHQDDPTGHWLAKNKENVRHICLPGEIEHYRGEVRPKELVEFYQDGLLDPVRMPWSVMKDLEADLGQYGFAGQIGQKPTPPGGGMFKVDRFVHIDNMPAPVNFKEIVRYWDKAGTKEVFGKKNTAAFTVGTKMYKLASGKWLISDVVRGRWSSEERERIIKATAEADGPDVMVYYEQEPGSGGKESAEGTTRNLAGFSAHADLPHGDKIYRADPYSVQVNSGNILLLKGAWNHEFIEEHRFFPFSTYKDQVDSASGAFTKLVNKRTVRSI